jgi:hypothetical protein
MFRIFASFTSWKKFRTLFIQVEFEANCTFCQLWPQFTKGVERLPQK